MVFGYLKRFSALVFIAVCCLNVSCGLLWAREAEEYKVKAAFIYNFIKFIQWPETAFDNSDAPCRICVMGNNDILTHFKGLCREKIKNRKIQIVDLAGTSDLKEPGARQARDERCHVLFVGRNIPHPEAVQIIRDMGEAPVVIIGESKGFIRMGGIINFFFKGDRLQFEINPAAAGPRQIDISSRLLKLAVIVEDSQ